MSQGHCGKPLARRRSRTRSCRHHRPHPFAKNAKAWGSLFRVAARMGQPPSEVVLNEEDGMKSPCAVNLHNAVTGVATAPGETFGPA